MASDSTDFPYSVILYLNDANILLRMRAAELLPRWSTRSPNLRDINVSGARTMVDVAEHTAELLLQKVACTVQLQLAASDEARWPIYNRMSGLRNGVRSPAARAHRGITGTLLLNTAVSALADYDASLSRFVDEVHQFKHLLQGVAEQRFTEPVPPTVSALLGDMAAYNESSKATFWGLLGPEAGWKLDPGRMALQQRLAALQEYPQASVIWARYLAPQIEAIEQRATAIGRDVQLRRGGWQLIANHLANVAHLLGGEGEVDILAWYADPFSLLARTQLRLMQQVAAQSAAMA